MNSGIIQNFPVAKGTSDKGDFCRHSIGSFFALFSGKHWRLPVLAAILLVALPVVKASCIPPPNTYSFEAEAWRVRVGTNGGTMSAITYRAGTVFGQELRWWGLRPLLVRRAGLYSGDNTNAMLTPFYTNTDGSTIDETVAFVAADYTEATGLTGNGTTKYLRVGQANTSLGSFCSHTNIHMALYIRTNNNTSTTSMGVAFAGTGNYGVAARNNNLTYTFTGNNVVNVADTNGAGFYCITRTATNVANAYKNGVSIVQDSGNDNGAIGSGFIVVHAYNNVGTPNNFTTRTISYYGMGQGIPAALAMPYRIAVRNFQVALGRAVE